MRRREGDGSRGDVLAEFRSDGANRRIGARYDLTPPDGDGDLDDEPWGELSRSRDQAADRRPGVTGSASGFETAQWAILGSNQ